MTLAALDAAMAGATIPAVAGEAGEAAALDEEAHRIMVAAVLQILTKTTEVTQWAIPAVASANGVAAVITSAQAFVTGAAIRECSVKHH